MKQSYKNAVVIVTGGTSGIGKELVLQLCSQGASVYFCGRSRERGSAVVAEAQSHGGRARFYEVDVTLETDVAGFIHAVNQEAGRIDWVFHGAGIILGGEFRDHEFDDIRNVLETNVMGTAAVSYHAYKYMAEQGHGHLVNLASAAGMFPVPLMGTYSASKFFVYGLSEVLRMEGKGIGVQVSTVAPGIIDTPIYETGRYSRTDKGFAGTLRKNPALSIPVDKAVRRILRGAARGQAVIFTQYYGRFGWIMYRLFPWGFRWFMRRGMGPYRKKLRKP